MNSNAQYKMTAKDNFWNWKKVQNTTDPNNSSFL